MNCCTNETSKIYFFSVITIEVRNEPKSIGLGHDIWLIGLGPGLKRLSFGLVFVICGLYNKAARNKTKQNLKKKFYRVKISWYISDGVP